MQSKFPGQKGAALVRFATVEEATWVVQNLNGNVAPGLQEPIRVKYANRGGARQSGWGGAGGGDSGAWSAGAGGGYGKLEVPSLSFNTRSAPYSGGGGGGAPGGGQESADNVFSSERC